MRAVSLLSWWKIRNSLRTVFTDPRKLVPLLIFVLALSVPIAASVFGLTQAPRSASTAHIDAGWFHSGIFLTLLLVVVGTLDMGLGDGLLAFPMSDVDYIFPSPISRKVVLAYKLPSLTLAAVFTSMFLIYMFKTSLILLGPSLSKLSPNSPPGWWTPVAVALCVGIYLNLGLFVSIRFVNRQFLHRLTTSVLIGFLVLLAGVGWIKGVRQAQTILDAPILGLLFYPAQLSTAIIFGEATNQVLPTSMLGLVFFYCLSLIPIFATNSNFYEHSIASSQRISSMRTAAKGGSASLMASKAAAYQKKRYREYTIPPFGQGSVALFWAHLSAAAKKPFINFLTPLGGGLLDGVLGAKIGNQDGMMGIAVLGGLSAYLSFSFMASAKTASEAAVRRRELIAPLPIKGYQCVMANLGVPLLGVMIFSLGAAITYSLFEGFLWPSVFIGLGVVFPLRLFARMSIQYLVVLGFPDFGDRVQQFLSMGAYYVIAAPLVVVELVLCLPAIFLKSVPVGLATLGAFELGLTFLALKITGIASDKAIATGEPIRLFSRGLNPPTPHSNPAA